MIKNFFRTAWRNLIKSPSHSFINIAGLSVGMAVAMLIGLWIWSELSFDKNFDNYNRIVQVMQTETHNGQINTAKGNVIPLAMELREKYPNDFKYVVLSSWSMNSLVAAGEKKISTQGNYMEPDAPDMLSLKMIAGSRNSFKSPSSVLLSRSTAKALFGDNDPLGKLIKIDGEINEKVAGVYEDFPQSSSFKEVSFIAPFFDLASWVKGNENNWYNNSFQVFAELSERADINKVSEKIRTIKIGKIDAQTAKLENPQMVLFPMYRWHLYSEFKNGVNTGGAIQYVWMFAVIGAFVLLLACINFMNLSTARSEKRAKEVGIRKAVGSLRSQLIGQFFSESILTAVVAFIVALQLTILALPFFNSVSGKQIAPPWGNINLWLIGISFSITTGLLAGLYPALYLSSFQPVKVLKGSFKAGNAAATPRKILVVTQFTVSVVLIISTIIVFKQVQFAKSRPTGYNKQGLITMVMRTYNYHNNLLNIRNDLLKQDAITEMSESSTPITENDHFSNGFSWEGMDAKQSAKFNMVGVTPEYGKTVGFEFVEGRDFSRQFATDSSAIIINEAAAKYIGFKKPVGRTIKHYDKNYTIIGVIKDVVMESPYEPVKPTIVNLDSTIGGIMNIRLNPGMQTATALAKVAAVCKKYSPEEPFDYSFADEEYAHKFADEERVGKLSVVFAALAIFISCLGIFGMASFMAEQRVKEIGVRKVLGASVYDLWQLQSKEFVMMVIISLLIATPVAYYFMRNWLQNYQYRTNLSWWIFVAAGFGLLLITILTVSYQTIKAAIANPVKSLRSE
ncbi:MAG: ABC transporter permease [Bacteroidetes bacterium]|nr:ABC transporter permease [Bacteroidota bacterium]